ncbi:MAG: hypothetical protein IJ624_04050 [Prevotella sp.]|jgi:hypothetical protein|nr:hypothetical protein [Prevotella sp.]
MNIYIKGNNIVSVRGKVWGKIYTRRDGKIEIDTISPLSTCYSLIADEKQRSDLELCIKRRFQQLTKQDLKWMRKNYGNAMKFIVRQFEENGVLTY